MKVKLMNLIFSKALGEKTKNLENLWLTLTVLLFIFRTAIPLFKYPFLVFYIIIAIYFLLKFWSKTRSTFVKLVRNYILVFLLILILVLSFLFSNKLYLVIFKDILNTLVLLSFFYFFSIIITTKEQLKVFVNSAILLIIFFASIISLDILFDLGITNNTNAKIDYNFALIPVFLGFIAILSELKQKKTKLIVCGANLFLIIFTYSILSSGSRRALFVFILIIIVLIFIQLFNFFKKNIILIKIATASRFYLCFMFILTMLLCLFVFKASNTFKYNTLEIFYGKNVLNSKNEITLKVSRYTRFINKNLTYNKLFDKIWSPEFDPKNPRSGWGSRVHNIEYPLKGRNVQIVPKNTKGYLMDSTCNANTWNNNAYSYTRFANVKVEKGDQIIASVYCYVSVDFDGSWVKISAEGSSSGHKACYYDLEKKGKWQKIVIEPECKEGRVPIYLYFSKSGLTDFSSLKGYVIFAYPTHEIISKKERTVFSDSLSNESHYSIFIKKIDKNIQKVNSKIKDAQYVFYNASIFNSLAVNRVLVSIQTVKDTDPFRNWIQKVFNEDTTYYGLKSDIDININAKDAIHGRTDRWRFAWQIYKKEYNWKQKIFGNGFDFLNWFGYYFYNDKTKSDWPHSPFISVLLYSGVVGLIIYLYLLYRVFAIYIKYIKEYFILFIFFGITFFFSFFSAGNPFDPPVMGFFIMLPFFIDFIHKKDNSY